MAIPNYKRALALLKQLDKTRTIIAKQRDKLRQQFGELEEIMSDVEDASETLDSGLREIESSIEVLSRNL